MRHTLFSGIGIVACAAIIALAKPLTTDLNHPEHFLFAGGGPQYGHPFRRH